METSRGLGIGIVMIIPSFVGSGAVWAVFNSWSVVISWIVIMVFIYGIILYKGLNIKK